MFGIAINVGEYKRPMYSNVMCVGDHMSPVLCLVL